MGAVVLLNDDGGTLKTADIESLIEFIRANLEPVYGSLDIIRVAATDMRRALQAVSESNKKIIIAVGGDGTVSACARLAFQQSKTLGLVPAGTMNLYARTLGIPLALDEAVKALVTAKVQDVDIATVNGEPFINQLTFGFQPSAVKLRSSIKFNSRIGKVIATFRAMLSVAAYPPALNFTIHLDDLGAKKIRISALSISNNLLSTGSTLHATLPDGGYLGIYRTARVGHLEAIKLIFDLIIGRWSQNRHVTMEQCTKIRIEVRRRRKRLDALRDGELVKLPRSSTIEIIPRSLKVLTPS